MEREHDTMMTPPIEDLLERVDSKFGLVTLAARRARNINAYFNQLGEGLGHMVPPQVASAARKPLSIGFQEIAADKIRWADLAEPAEEAPAEGVDAVVPEPDADAAEDVETES
jgi:DNA-directed RNA polymerase subunit omega